MILKSNLSELELSELLIQAELCYIIMLTAPYGATLSAEDTDHVSIALSSNYDLYWKLLRLN